MTKPQLETSQKDADKPVAEPAEQQAETAQQRTALAQITTDEGSSISAFASRNNFQAAQRMAQALASSSVVPQDYRGEKGLPNCLVALELASRTGASVLMVMQNLHIIQGKPSWASAFLIGSVNSCGRFTALRFETQGGDDPQAETFKCRAYAKEKSTGDTLFGEWITWKMVKLEGWKDKSGSKWVTMPGQMFRYRAAAFWTRVYAPDIALGMQTAEEVVDITDAVVEQSPAVRDLNAAIGKVPTAEAIVK